MSCTFKREWLAPAAVALGFVYGEAVPAEESRFDVGVRGVVLIGDGVPSNDMLGYGIVGRWVFRESWRLGVAIDTVEFDYETPYRVLGIESTEEIDTVNEFTRVSLVAERHFSFGESPWSWFLAAEAGFASIDVGGNAVGVTPGGQPFEIATDADDELHFAVGAGLRRSFGDHLAVDAVVTLQHHTTDYRLVDLASGATGSIGSQSPYGLTLGLHYTF